MRLKFKGAIEEFSEMPRANEMIINSLREIVPQKGNLFGFFSSLFFAVMFSVIISTSDNTVELTQTVTGILINILLAIFGCIFAVYSIIISFLSNKYIERLVEVKDQDTNKSYLKICLMYYESALFLYFISICITGIVALFCNCLPEMYRLTDSIVFDTMLALVLLCCYFLLILRVIYELKSVIYNTILILRYGMIYRLIDLEKEPQNEK